MNRLRGAAALLLLLGIVVGTPLGLIAAGSAVDVPSIGELGTLLTQPDRTGSLLVTALLIVSWVAWALLTLSIVVEVVARLSNVRAPTLPGLRLPQSAAHGLIATVALLFTTAPLAPAALALPTVDAVTASPVPVTQDAVAAPAADRRATEERATPTPAPQPTYTVVPGDTLWDIAATQLGDGYRFTEIVALNQGRVQPDGRVLSPDNWVYPGWELLLPSPPPPAPSGETRDYVVQDGDTLWDIADAELGDGDRYPEIVALNVGRPQPGGFTLTDPDVISTGWTLRIPTDQPADAAPPDSRAGTAAATDPSDPTPAAESRAADRGGAALADGTSATTAGTGAESGAEAAASHRETAVAESAVQAPTRSAAPTATTTGPGAQTGASAETADEADDSTDAAPLRTIGGIGALLAAGLLALWAGHRQLQRWRARPGQQLEPLDEQAVGLLSTLSRTEDPQTRLLTGRALKLLAAGCAATDTPLPPLAAVLATPSERVTVYLDATTTLSPPWAPEDADGWVWGLPATAPELDDTTLDDQPAPYPALVTLGHDNQAHLLVDLEQIGSLGVQGDPELVRDVTAALALELAVSGFADDLTVTVIGGFAELEGAVGNGQIRYLPSAARYLDDLEKLATDTGATLAAAGHTDLPSARPAGAAADVSAPEIAVFLTAPTDSERERLQRLLHTRPRAAIAAVTAGHTPLGEHVLEVISPDSAVYQPAQEPLVPQLIDDDSFRQLMQLLSSALDDPRDEPSAEPTWTEPDLHDLPDPAPTPLVPAAATAPSAPEPDVDPTPPADEPTTAHTGRDDDAPLAAVSDLPAPAPQLLVLGDVELTGVPAPAEPRKIALFVEVIAFLTFRPGSDRYTLMRELWAPGRAPSQSTFNTTITKTRKWLGTDPDGHHYLPKVVEAGEYRVMGLRTDWDRWQQLVPTDPADASTEALTEAIGLIRGYPFSGASSRRYTWAIPEKEQIAVRVVAAARELARRLLLSGRYPEAMAAAEAGIRVMPQDQELWRIRLKAASKAGDRGLVQALVDRFVHMAEGLGGDVEPDTERLLAELSVGPLRIAV